MSTEDAAVRDNHGAPIFHFGVAEDQGKSIKLICACLTPLKTWPEQVVIARLQLEESDHAQRLTG